MPYSYNLYIFSACHFPTFDDHFGDSLLSHASLQNTFRTLIKKELASARSRWRGKKVVTVNIVPPFIWVYYPPILHSISYYLTSERYRFGVVKFGRTLKSIETNLNLITYSDHVLIEIIRACEMSLVPYWTQEPINPSRNNEISCGKSDLKGLRLGES